MQIRRTSLWDSSDENDSATKLTSHNVSSMKLSKLKIRLCENGLAFPYSVLLVNGRQPFRVSSQETAYGKSKIYMSKEFLEEPIYCIEGVAPEVIGGGFLPRRILLNNRTFIHRLGNFFTPEKLSEEAVVSFFNILAPRYDRLIEGEPNSEIVKRVFEVIKLRYGLKKAKKPRLRKKQPLLILDEKKTPEASQPGIPFTSPSIRENPIKILDWGTGTGLSHQIYRKKRGLFKKCPILTGCDVSEGMLQRCREKAKDYEVFKCEYASSPFPDCFFDVVFAVFVSPYFIDERPYREVFRILKPGGFFAFNLTSSDYIMNGKRLDQVLREIGFRVVNFERWRIVRPENTRDIPMVFAEKDI